MKKIWKQRYQIMKETGRGGNARVYKVWDIHLEKEWAMKVLEKENMPVYYPDETMGSITELQVLKKVSHNNFPRIVDAFEEEGRIIFIMDYVQGVTLEEILRKGPMKETEILFVLQQVCEAILYLHQQNPILLFLDLKPANIMIEDSGRVKLIDMGSVAVKGQQGNVSGSFGFVSPEQIKVQREGSYITEQSDIFSFGMVLYSMAVGDSQKMPVVESGSRWGITLRKRMAHLSVSMERILEKCTRGNPNRRYAGMREVKKELEKWEKELKSRRGVMRWDFFSVNRTEKCWFQEKSVFCTEGRSSFYIAKKILILGISVLGLVPGKVSLAGKINDMDVIIRDTKLRKVLVKEGCAYETDSNIILEIPWEGIEGKNCKILVECEDESREKKRFYVECIYAK